IQWCAGCGDTLIIGAIKKAFQELKIVSHERVVISGVGCSGKASQYIDGYAAETLHGRTLPFATGVKMSKPKMTVMAIGGDGDGYGIGMGHFIHSCKRDLNITYIVMDNENYALTTGQASPTTSIGAKTKTTPDGNLSKPFDPIAIAKKAGCSFAKIANSIEFMEMKEIIKKAIKHEGFSVVNISQACPSFKKW
ncbi:MAG: 2-oxoacid:ferredoxin oxidoreductase subunit beta, partial [Candidatus Gracilibacteria bacterium]|nr:2-oxoacid:ferredoxin oxidoreductase subunit beta [Candidatus Gracilibacteria bacterium]